MLFYTVTVVFCLQGLVMASLECMDWQGKAVSDGMDFYPNKNDPCLLCRCEKGYTTMCKTVSCAPPNCPNWKSIPGECCKFECLDKNGVATKIENSTGSPSMDGDVSGMPTDNTVTDLGLRLVASTVTTFLILALLLFLIHRFRQRRLLMTLRRYSRRREPLDDLDSISYSPDFFGIQCPPYEDPPPPYTPPKPQPGEEPPPYEAIEGDPGNQGIEGQQIRNNPTLNCDQNCNNVNGNFMDRDVNSSAVCRNHSSGIVNNVISENSNRCSENSNRCSENSNRCSENINTGTNNEGLRIHRNVSDRSFDCRMENNSLQQNSGNIQSVDTADVANGNSLSVHFRNNPFGPPSITMGVQNRNRHHRNRYSDGNFNLSSIRNLSNRNTPSAVNDHTAALNLELQNTVRNYRNRNIQVNNRHSAPNTGDLSSSTTDIGESTTSAESLSSSPESPHCHIETGNLERSGNVLAEDANSTVRKFLDRQFGPLPKNRRYPTTMSQSWTSAQVSPTGQNFRQSISLGSFPPKPDFQTVQKNSCVASTPNCIGNRILPRSKSEHLKTNGSLINQPYKSPSRNMPVGQAVRVAYKEPEELGHKHMHNRNSCDLNSPCRDAGDGVESNASVCSGQVGSSSSRLTAAILDPGDIIVTKRHDELRKLRLSHLLNKQTCSLDSTNLDFFIHGCSPRQLQRSFSENSVNSLSVCSETGERSGAGVALSNDAPYPVSSYKNFEQSCMTDRSCHVDDVTCQQLPQAQPLPPSQQSPRSQHLPSSPQSSGSQHLPPSQQSPQSQCLPPSPQSSRSQYLPPSQQMPPSQQFPPSQHLASGRQLPQNREENTHVKYIAIDQTASSSNSEVSSCKSTPKKENVKMEMRRKLPDVSMIHSWHGGQVDSCDENISLSRFSMNTLSRNVNRNINKKTCMDKDVSNMFFPYYKPCNIDVEIDRNCVPSSEMRACASQLYNYETEEKQGKKSKKKPLLKRHSAGCFPVPATELKCHSPRTVQKQYQRLKSSRSSDRQTTQRVMENSSKDNSRTRVPSRERKSGKRLLPAGKETCPKVTDLTPSHLLQSHLSSGRPNTLNLCRNENFDMAGVPFSNSVATSGKKRSKSLGRDVVCSTTRSRASQSRKKKRQSVPAANPFQEELEHALQQHKGQVKSPSTRFPKNGLDRNQSAITQV